MDRKEQHLVQTYPLQILNRMHFVLPVQSGKHRCLCLLLLFLCLHVSLVYSAHRYEGDTKKPGDSVKGLDSEEHVAHPPRYDIFNDLNSIITSGEEEFALPDSVKDFLQTLVNEVQLNRPTLSAPLRSHLNGIEAFLDQYESHDSALSDASEQCPLMRVILHDFKKEN